MHVATARPQRAFPARIARAAWGAGVLVLCVIAASTSLARDPSIRSSVVPALVSPAPDPPPRNPLRSAPATSTAATGAQRPRAMWSASEIETERQRCTALLTALDADIEPSPPIDAAPCGAAAPVLVRRIGRDPSVEIEPPALLGCPMVAALGHWIDTTLQPQARAGLGTPIVRLVNASAYVCRLRNNADEGKISEHAFANALDISALVTADGRSISLASHWGPTARDQRQSGPSSPASRPLASLADAAPGTAVGSSPEAGAFLRAIHAGACGPFSTVLGPEANEAHRDHLHLDLATRRRGPYCQ